MNTSNVFENFSTGILRLPNYEQAFNSIEWSQHPTFEGVQLKHILTSKDTKGLFSYHLVQISPNKAIKTHIHKTQLETHEVIKGNGVCVNNGVRLDYCSGTISIFPAGVEHEIIADSDGLFLFAKFYPALC